VQTPPREVPDDLVLDAVRSGWSPRAERAAYLPVGFGSHHWEVTGADGERWFATVDEVRGDASSSTLAAALSVPHAAREAGVVGVHAPVPATDGLLVHRIRRAWVVSVQPWLVGDAGRFGDRLQDDEALAVVDLLVGLHAVPPDRTRARVDDDTVPGRGMLEALVARLGDPGVWRAGPLAAGVRELLVEHGYMLARALAAHDAEADPEAPLVVTHGEPHPGNLVRTPSGPCLVDWDTALLATPERDLWLVAARSGPDVVGRYEEASGRTVDVARLRHQERRWALTDVADYVPALAGAPEETEDTAWQWEALVGTLADLERLSTRVT
jgi:spectinomycin phosphotransferase